MMSAASWPESLREQLHPIFYPRSIAIVGASANPTKTGNVLVQHLLDYQFPGGIYPTNPEGGEILGVKAYPSVLDVPGEIDLAIIVVGRAVVEQAVADCVAKGVKGAVIPKISDCNVNGSPKTTRLHRNRSFEVIHAAGFGEAGQEGKAANGTPRPSTSLLPRLTEPARSRSW